MDDLNNPRISAYKPQRRLLLPKPPGYRSKPTGAQRKQKARAQARANARAARLHLVGLTDAAVIVMGLIVAAMIVLLVVLMISHGL
jgi:ribosomal protein S6E (S10)